MNAHEPGRGDDERLAEVFKVVGQVAHDLNNALLVIRGYSSVLRTALQSPDQIADVDEIAKAADHAATLTRRLLELQHPSDSAEPSVVAAVEGNETILLVEDDRAVRDLVCRMLESAGYRVLLASRPSEAEVLAREQHVDLLLSDVVMPEMTGFQLAQRLSQDRPKLRTLFISGNAYVASSSSSRADADILKKPFAPGELTQAVRSALDRPSVPA